ncbi:MAG: thiamine pyrophosphate-binding protein [Chloroflexi bacterium]|nr:thiamine pyrophosphate-binding protein [Chloroflexota bacterium]
MARMTGGQALIKSLYREGVRTIFGMPGVQLYHAMDAIYEEPGIRFITVRHEQAAAYMAFGYSKAGGDGIGTALVVPGPGLLNATAGVGTAYSASTPTLLVSGQSYTHEIGKDTGALHEVNDQLDVVRPITKWAARMTSVGEVPDTVHEAFRMLKTGRQRPVEIEIAWDTLEDVEDVELHEPAIYEPLVPEDSEVERVVEMLSQAERPLIWAGWGVALSDAGEALAQVAEHMQAPVMTSAEGKGAVPYDHPLSLGTPGWRFGPPELAALVGEADLVLAVGTRLGRTNLTGEHNIVHIDVDAEEIGRIFPQAVGVHGDARVTLERLYGRLLEAVPQRESRVEEIAAIKRKRANPATFVQPQGGFVEAIQNVMPNDGIIVEGVTQIGYASRELYTSQQMRTYITSSYFGNLGYAYPTALGAKVAKPDVPVLAISGDGGFMYNSQELATAVKYGINAVAVVFNDNAYGNVYRDQINKFDGRAIGSQLHNPDFMKLADAYGARGVRVHEPEELETALREALDANAPGLIEVPVGMMPDPFV